MIGVTNTEANIVTLQATYVENSPAVGVVFALLYNDRGGSVSFINSVYLVLDRVGPDSSVRGNLSQGHYAVVAFEVQRNGRLQIGRTLPASVASVIVYGKG